MVSHVSSGEEMLEGELGRKNFEMVGQVVGRGRDVVVEG